MKHIEYEGRKKYETIFVFQEKENGDEGEAFIDMIQQFQELMGPAWSSTDEKQAWTIVAPGMDSELWASMKCPMCWRQPGGIENTTDEETIHNTPLEGKEK